MYMYKFKARQCNVFFVWNKYFLFLKLEFRYCFFGWKKETSPVICLDQGVEKILLTSAKWH